MVQLTAAQDDARLAWARSAFRDVHSLGPVSLTGQELSCRVPIQYQLPEQWRNPVESMTTSTKNLIREFQRQRMGLLCKKCGMKYWCLRQHGDGLLWDSKVTANTQRHAVSS